MIEMPVADKKPWNGHVIPGMSTDIEANLQLVDPPVRLHGGARVAIDREVAKLLDASWKIAKPRALEGIGRLRRRQAALGRVVR